MSLSIQKMVSDGTLSTIVLGVQYLQRNDIYMRIAGVETPQSGAISGYTWSFLDNNTIRVLPVVPAGVEVTVYRRTDSDSMYNIYSQNAQFDESTIDENNQQLLYIAQEYLEQGIPGAGIEALEYARTTDAGHYYSFKLTDGSYTPEFLVPTSDTELANRAMWARFAAESGYVLAAGDFETGGVLLNSTQVLLAESTQGIYSWSGVYPEGGKVIPSNSTPATSGGVSPTAWVDRTGGALRNELASPTGSEIVGFGLYSNVSSELDRLAKRTIIDAREFGLTTSGVNDTSLLLTAISQCKSVGATLGVSGILDFGDAEVTVSDMADIFGPGGFKSLRFVINQSGDIFKQINGLSVSTQAVGGDHGFVIKKGRFLDFLNIRATGVESVIKGEADSGTAFHSIGLITVNNMNALNIGRMVDLRHASADALAYNDFKFINNRGWFTRYGGFYAEQLDGLIFADNLLHAGRNQASHTNHLYVNKAEWINIAGANTFFEGGREAMLIGDVGRIAIGGSNIIAFCGQQQPSSGVKVDNSTSSKFMNLSIADGAVSTEKSTLHGVEVLSQSGISNIGKVAVNIDVRAGDVGGSQTYFGTTPLSSISHNGVNISGGVTAHGARQSIGLLINQAGISARIIDRDTSSGVRSVLSRSGNKSASASQTLSTNIASGVATTIIGPISYETGSSSNACAGKITVQAYNDSNTKVGVYELLYRRNSSTSADVTEMSHIYDSTIVADTPAFSFQTSGSGSIQVFPKELTAGGGFVNGTFTFVFNSTGNITFSPR